MTLEIFNVYRVIYVHLILLLFYYAENDRAIEMKFGSHWNISVN